MDNFDFAFATVSALVKDFRENEKRYLSHEYQEAEVRRDFIDKFFNALGWDVYHSSQKNPYEQEVKVEKGVSIGKAQKRADYAFYISPEFRQPKFFTEAKKPSRNLKNADDYFQAIRYGWNANTPIAVLTDFEELHILDCRLKPNINTVLQNPNHKTYRYTDYADSEKFKEIFFLFSRDSVANNSLAKYSNAFQMLKGKAKESFKRAYQAIDDDFLEYIDEVRETIAKAFKKNDAKLASEELTEATQRTIDRLVFIRFLEDKLIEPEYYISGFGRRGNAWKDFISTCRTLDAKYNGIVFKKHFIDEQSFQGPEQNTFKKICDEMSYQNSPYDFNAIPIHILGSIYERFLGKIVNATAQRVKVEEKPEIRKAGGVYYTPKYIVDYIVDNTVGKIIRNEKDSLPSREGVGGVLGNDKGKTPLEISKLRFADIACGSGSFLIGVFETLLKYHTEYYQQHPEQAKKDGCIEKDEQWILSIKQKQKILINNIYGVDIDQQATEVTQLSLALKMLEDESTATANDMQVLFHEKILPDLSKNIICGNSLIGTDILKGKMFASEEERKLNPMDFESTFPEIMKNGGFDAIVGNPPYVYTRDKGISEIEKLYYYSNYHFQSPQLNTFGLFVERAFTILKENGSLGYIIPNNWLSIDSFSTLRKFILEMTGNAFFVNILDKVFQDANVDTCILTFEKKKSKYLSICEMENQRITYSKKIDIDIISAPQYIFQIGLLKNASNYNLVKKIENNSAILSEYSTVSTGVKVYQTGKGVPRQTDFQKMNRVFHATRPKNKSYFKYLEGIDVCRYYLGWSGEYLSYGDWIAEPRKSVPFDRDRILIRQIPSKLPYMVNAIFTNETFINDINSMVVFNSKGVKLKFLLSCINSKLISFWFDKKFDKMQRKIFPQFKVKELSLFPIPKINLQNESDKKSHYLIVQLVEQMLEAKKQLNSAKTDKDKTYYERKCESLDKQIDAEVYKLYGLTEEEIKIVEGRE